MATCHNCGVIMDAGGEWIKDKFFCTDCASHIKTADYLKEEYFRLQSRLAEAEILLYKTIPAVANTFVDFKSKAAFRDAEKYKKLIREINDFLREMDGENQNV